MIPAPGHPAGVPRPRIGLVSHRHRLCAAAGRPLRDAADLLAAQVAGAAMCGVEFFQVREPDLDGGALLALVTRLRAVADGRVRLVVNDRADVAACSSAGLHLKRASMALARVRAWLPPGTWVSCAVHDESEVHAAAGADALIAGTVQPTVSKPDAAQWLGLEGLARLTASTPAPVFAIGGLTGRDWPALAAAGAAGIAAIGWVLPRPGEDPSEAVVRAVLSLVGDGPAGDARS